MDETGKVTPPGAEQFKAPEDREKKSWRSLRGKPNWLNTAMLALGATGVLGLPTQIEASPNTENQNITREIDKEELKAEEAMGPTVEKSVVGLLAENKIVKETPSGKLTEIKGRLELSMGMLDFVKKMNPLRNSKRAEEGFNNEARKIKSLSPVNFKKELFIMSALGNESEMIVLEANEGKVPVSMFGRIETVGNFVDMLTEGTMKAWNVAYKNSHDPKKAAEVANSVLSGAMALCQDGDPRETDRILEQQVK